MILNKAGISKIEHSNHYFDSVYENREYHENGQLAYFETWAKISNMFIDLFEKGISSEDGYWIRIGEQSKYYDNGQLNWRLKYNNKGEILNKDGPAYRKDGTIIEY